MTNKRNILWIGLVIFLVAGFSISNILMTREVNAMNEKTANLEEAYFAGGCFWCVESGFEHVKGVHEVISGYTGGKEKNPSYKEVSAGLTGHYEAVKVLYDPKQISYEALVEEFWRQVNPTDDGGQFVDRGEHYRTAIFYRNDEEKKIAEASKVKLDQSGIYDKPVVTPVIAATDFYAAEDYHQDYYKKNPVQYKIYRFGSGRDQYLKNIWKGKDMKKNHGSNAEHPTYKKQDDEQLKKTLSPMQYKVTQKDGTEPPFKNEFWDNKREGIYVDIVSGEPLFSSRDKYDSKTGWPSFTKPLVEDHVLEKEDRSLFMVRTEVRSKYGDSHLGHVFDDGPAPTGLRYCINSASLRFVPAEDLEKEGYTEFSSQFAV